MRLADFEGCWQLSRQIDDRLLARIGSFEGEARFAPGMGGLIYDETGALRFPGEAPLQAKRRYIWRETDSGIDVTYADGREFHRFEMGRAMSKAHHDCTPDTYLVTYDFTNWPDWSAEWQVSGPRKDYAMTTRYKRSGPFEADGLDPQWIDRNNLIPPRDVGPSA